MSYEITLPESFTASHYSHIHVAALMSQAMGINISEPVFLSLVSSGKVPAGVNLMPVLGIPLLVWPNEDINAWLAAGCPVSAELIERERRVRDSLRNALAEVGETLPEPANPVTPMELN